MEQEKKHFCRILDSVYNELRWVAVIESDTIQGVVNRVLAEYIREKQPYVKKLMKDLKKK